MHHLKDKLAHKAEAKLGIDLDGDGHVGAPGANQAPEQPQPYGAQPQPYATGAGAYAGAQAYGAQPYGGQPQPYGSQPYGSAPAYAGAGAGAYAGAQAYGSQAPAQQSDDGKDHHYGAMAAGAAGVIGAALFATHSDSESSDDDHHGAMLLGAVGVGGLAFFMHMKHKKKKDYVVIVDASASMMSGVMNPLGATRWSETQKSISVIASEVCKADPDGITLYFFNDRVQRFDNVKHDSDVNRVFSQFAPAGFTDLTSALDQAFVEHFTKKKKRSTSILVIHDGEPNNAETVKGSLRKAANEMKKKKELHISFVQVGEDPQATAFLHQLDVGLGTKYDIVDKMHSQDFQGVGFAEAVTKGCA